MDAQEGGEKISRIHHQLNRMIKFWEGNRVECIIKEEKLVWGILHRRKMCISTHVQLVCEDKFIFHTL